MVVTSWDVSTFANLETLAPNGHATACARRDRLRRPLVLDVPPHLLFVVGSEMSFKAKFSLKALSY